MILHTLKHMLKNTEYAKSEKNIERKELLHIVNKLHKLFHHSPVENDRSLSLAIRVAGAYFRWHSCEGAHGLKRAKAASNYFVRHLMGTPLESIPLSNRYKRMIDSALSLCITHRDKVYWVSVFSAVRLFYVKPDYDVSTITSGFKGHLTGLLKWKYLSSLKRVNRSFSVAQNWSAKFKWHISGSAGPNGGPAYAQYLNDLRSLSNSWLTVGLVILYLALPYDNREETANTFRNAYRDMVKIGEEDSIHSRLVHLSTKGGKTRLIAIADIVSQSLLHTVHERCNLVLRRLKQDGTFDQDSARCYIKKMSRDSVPLASIDLTAATDRMPALYQVFVLISLRILTPLQAFGWYWVTTKRTFVYNQDGVQKHVRYNVGQPMGLLSSWPVMAISHHYLVRLSFAAQGINPKKAPYRVLGDDLTLRGFDVADEYLRLISYLGMDFSQDKTYISIGVAEFAKSLFCFGEDLTPFPLALLKFNKNTLVSNVLAILAESKRINLSLTAQSLRGLFPYRWRNLVHIAALSPSSPRYALDLQPREDQWVFLQFIYVQKLAYFGRLKTFRDSTSAFMHNDPGFESMATSPFAQIGFDNSENYPIWRVSIKKRNLSSDVLLGSGWISYCTKTWPKGLPPLGDANLIPGPTWKKDMRKELIFRSSLIKFNKIMPNYFTVRCVGKQVGE